MTDNSSKRITTRSKAGKTRNPEASRIPVTQSHLVGAFAQFPGVQKSLSRRLHRKQASDYLGVSLSWLDKSRLTGLGPVFISIGGRVVYDSADLDAFLENNRRASTSE